MYMKLKKVVFLVVVLSLSMILSSVSVFASEDVLSSNDDNILSAIERTNEFIEQAIIDACEKADRIVAEILAGDQPLKEEKIDAALDILISNLLKITDNKVEILIKKADREGVEILKSFVEVIIYDRIVIVDPCYAH